jgi:hypothetical protein
VTVDDAVRRLTLDTNCISALANPQASNYPAEVRALEQLFDLARSRRLTVQLASAYDRDFERWTDVEGQAQRLAWLAQAPEIRRIGGVFRLDVSVLDGPDVLGSNAETRLDERLRAILAPAKTQGPIPGYEVAPGVAAKWFADIDHLIAHRMSEADFFVTLDESTILSRRVALQGEGIVVCRPTEVLVWLDRP